MRSHAGIRRSGTGLHGSEELQAEANSLRTELAENQKAQPKLEPCRREGLVQRMRVPPEAARSPCESAKPGEASELLANALKAVVGKPDEDKRKAKEAETVKLPDFAKPEAYRPWKISVREAVNRTNSTKPSTGSRRFMHEHSASLEVSGSGRLASLVLLIPRYCQHCRG